MGGREKVAELAEWLEALFWENASSEEAAQLNEEERAELRLDEIRYRFQVTVLVLVTLLVLCGYAWNRAKLGRRDKPAGPRPLRPLKLAKNKVVEEDDTSPMLAYEKAQAAARDTALGEGSGRQKPELTRRPSGGAELAAATASKKA